VQSGEWGKWVARGKILRGDRRWGKD
jgi:hypothetical protein